MTHVPELYVTIWWCVLIGAPVVLTLIGHACLVQRKTVKNIYPMDRFLPVLVVILTFGLAIPIFTLEFSSSFAMLAEPQLYSRILLTLSIFYQLYLIRLPVRKP